MQCRPQEHDGLALLATCYGEGKSDGCIGTSYELCYLNGMALTSSPTPCRRSHVAFRNSVSPHPLGRFFFFSTSGDIQEQNLTTI